MKQDTHLRLLYGTGVALFLLAMLLAAPRIGAGSAVAFGSLLIGWGVERYQAIRHEGTPDNKDRLASLLPGLLLGAAIEALARLHLSRGADPMLKTLAAFALALTAPLAAAQHQTGFWCTPQTVATPNGEGSPLIWNARLDGGWAAWWCPVIMAGGQPGFRGYYWAGLYTYGWSKMPAASERVQASEQPNEQAKAEVFAAAASAANAVDACKHRMLRRDACIALQTSVMPGYPPPMSAASAAQRCGTPQNCTALPPPAEVWRTPASGTGTLYTVVNGRRVAAISGRVAPPSTPCSCSTADIPYTPVPGGPVSHFCALASGPANEVTLCRQVP
jgi:hypothetical protein